TRRALIAENLKGKWLASINADTAIAIAFGPGNSFQMVHVVAGKQSSSRGVYASKGNGIEFRENGQQKASLRFDVNAFDERNLHVSLSGRTVKFVRQ
ncbi:MAG: hypothetical protein AAFN70_19880, partial [Planctomycetota bacterium]